MGKRKQKRAESQEKPKRKKKRRVRKVMFLLIVGGIWMLVSSETARNKVLDVLFGSEEEFQYSPPSSPSGDGAGSAAS